MIFGQEVLIFPPFIAGERDFSAIYIFPDCSVIVVDPFGFLLAHGRYRYPP